ncbi:MAG: hypothetical protein JXR86_11865 [Spirochaetales bacterium]|nr:hypothetical protein [Spirochaetales bacterium]
MFKILKSLLFYLLFFIALTVPALPQDAVSEVPPVTDEQVDVNEKSVGKGQMTFFLDKRLVFALSVTDGGFGFGGTVNVQYIFPFHLGLGLEAGYYGFRSEIYQDQVEAVGGFSLIPIYAAVSFNIPVIENFYITPVIKGGGAYARARINGWQGGDSFAPVFEGGIRLKGYIRGGLLLQGGIFYTGLIEASGLFSILSVGMGFGL